MKTKIILTVALIISCVTGTALTMHFAKASKEKVHTVVEFENEYPEEKKEVVKVGDIVIKEIKKEVNITSNTYDFTFPFEYGTLEEDAGFWKSVGHGLAGKSYTANVHASAELKTNLLGIKREDINYDEETKSITILLEKPKLRVWLNHDKLDSDSFEAIFSGGYSENERNKIYDKMEKASKVQFETTKTKEIEDAKSDIIEGLTYIVSPDSLIENADAPKEIKDLIKNIHISFKE